MFITPRHIISDCFAIIRKKHFSFSKKVRLLSDYLRIAFKRFLHGRISFMVDHSREKIGGLTVEMNNYSDFYWTFREVFVHEDYYFHTDKKDPFIVDCGGNVGVSVLYFKYLYPKARILVFEPLEENLSFLRKNIKNLRDVSLEEVAVGKEKGEKEIFGDRRAATIYEGLINEQNKKTNVYKEKKEMIKVDTLSSYLGNERIDFLKLDIEGAETDVLRDLNVVGKMKNVEQVGMEYHRFSFTENKLSELIDILESNKFDTIFSCSFDLTNIPRRKYYNFMLYATKREAA